MPSSLHASCDSKMFVKENPDKKKIKEIQIAKFCYANITRRLHSLDTIMVVNDHMHFRRPVKSKPRFFKISFVY